MPTPKTARVDRKQAEVDRVRAANAELLSQVNGLTAELAEVTEVASEHLNSAQQAGRRLDECREECDLLRAELKRQPAKPDFLASLPPGYRVVVERSPAKAPESP